MKTSEESKSKGGRLTCWYLWYNALCDCECVDGMRELKSTLAQTGPGIQRARGQRGNCRKEERWSETVRGYIHPFIHAFIFSNDLVQIQHFDIGKFYKTKHEFELYKLNFKKKIFEIEKLNFVSPLFPSIAGCLLYGKYIFILLPSIYWDIISFSLKTIQRNVSENIHCIIYNKFIVWNII